MRKHKMLQSGSLNLLRLTQKIFAFLFLLGAAGFAHGADGDLDASFQAGAQQLGTVYTSVAQPDGKILIGGNFFVVNGVPRRSLARLNADGTLDRTFLANVTGNVHSILVQPDGKILVGGAVMLNLPGRQRANFFRLNADGTSDDAFNTGEGATSGTVLALARQADGKILVGGNFDWFNGFSSNGMLRVNADGTRDTAFGTSTSGDDGNNGVYAIAVQADGRIVIAGDFMSVNSESRVGVARLHSNGATDASFTGAVTSLSRRQVYALAVQPDNKIIIGGFFNQINGLLRNKIVRFNTDGSLDTTFQGDVPTALYTVRTVRLQADGRILVGGFFAQINATVKSNVARLFANGTLDTGFTAETNGTVYDIIPSANPIFAGEFTKLNNTDSFGVSRTDASGSRDNNFSVGTGTSGVVRDLAAQPDGRLVVGGEFSHFENSPRRNIARVNNDGTLDQTFNPGTGFEAGSRVNDLVLHGNSKIAVAGNFNTFNGTPQRMIVVLNADGSRDESFNANFTQSGEIRKIVAYPGGKFLILGSFRFGSETTAVNFAMLNADGSRDASFAPTFAPTGTALFSAAAQPDGKILIVGNFTSVNGTPKNYIARLNADGSLDNSLTLNLTNYNIQSGITEVDLQPDGKILVAGTFQPSAAQFYSPVGLLRLNPTGARDLSFNPPSGKGYGAPFKLMPDGRILVRMVFEFDFTTFASIRTFVARLRPNGTLDYSFKINYRGVKGSGGTLALELMPDNKVVVGGSFPEYSDTQRVTMARLENSMAASAAFDFEGDGRTDISIFRPASGEWWLNRSSTTETVAAQFGVGTDKPMPADYTGDGKTDIAFWRPSSGEWFILRSEDGSFLSFPFGAAGDLPLVGDFDADGRADPAVFRPATGTWYILKSTGGVIIRTFGSPGDVPVPGDYDGDDKTDFAIYRPSGGQWWISRSASNVVVANFGTSTDKPVQGDYSGDGRTDVAFFRPSTGEWFILRSEDTTFFSVRFGAPGDLPAPGDYDGDGIFDTAIFRPTGATWFIQQSSAGTAITTFGIPGDQPVPNSFVP